MGNQTASTQFTWGYNAACLCALEPERAEGVILESSRPKVAFSSAFLPDGKAR